MYETKELFTVHSMKQEIPPKYLYKQKPLNEEQ